MCPSPQRWAGPAGVGAGEQDKSVWGTQSHFPPVTRDDPGSVREELTLRASLLSVKPSQGSFGLVPPSPQVFIKCLLWAMDKDEPKCSWSLHAPGGDRW